MNFDGCPVDYARDNTLDIGRNDSAVAGSLCEVPTPFYIFYMSLCTFIVFLVALGKTVLIIQTQRQFKKNKRQYSRFKALISYFAAFRQILSFFCCLVLTFLPFALPNANGSIIPIFLGLQMSTFVLASERWLSKLIRLGKRIIPKYYRHAPDSSNPVSSSGQNLEGHDTFSELDNRLQNSDFFLKFLDSLAWICLIIVFFSICIFTQIFPTSRVSLNVGVGVFGVSIITLSSGMNWQYHRCIQYLKKSQEAIQGVGRSKNDRLEGVTRMFRMQQKILFFFGTLGTIVNLLFAVEVIAINWTLLIVTHTFDAVVQGAILITFLRNKKFKASSTKSKHINHAEPEANKTVDEVTHGQLSNNHLTIKVDTSIPY